MPSTSRSRPSRRTGTSKARASSRSTSSSTRSHAVWTSSYGRSKPTARQRTRTIMVDHLGSSYAAGFISVLMLGLARVTGFGAHLQGAWHVIYVVSASAALYFNLLLG